MFFFSRRFDMFLTPQNVLNTQFLTSHVPYDKCSGPKPINTKKTSIALRANVGIYRESQISSEKSNFGLYHPNNLLVWLFQKMILKNPQALCIWIILEKFENSQKNTIFIHEISHNFERFQRNSTGAKDLLLTSSSSHI